MSESVDTLRLTQYELAKLFQLDRATLTTAGRDGLPFIREGRENLYDVGVAMYWFLGRDCLRKNPALRGVTLATAEQVAVGWMLGQHTYRGVHRSLSEEERTAYTGLMQRMGATVAEAESALGVARGIFLACY